MKSSSQTRLVALASCMVFVTCWAGIAMTRESGRIATIWLADGVLLGVLLTAPRSQWMTLLLGGFIANVAANLLCGVPPGDATSLPACNSMEVLVAAVLIQRTDSEHNILGSSRSIIAFALYGVVLAPLLSAALAAVVLADGNLSHGLQILTHWFLADALGTAIVTPLFVALRTTQPDASQRLLARGNLPSLVLLIVVTAAVFMQSRYPLLFLAFPLMTLLTYRTGYRGAAVGSAIIATIAITATLTGSGPLMLVPGAETSEKILLLQAFVAVALLSSFPLAALLQREERLTQTLSRSEQRLRSITDNLPAMVVYVDAEERYCFVNSYFARFAGSTAESLIGRTIREVWGEDVYAERRNHVRSALGGAAITFEGFSTVEGVRHHYQSNYIPDRDDSGAVVGFYKMTFDITPLKEVQHQLDRLARFDALTGLANRREFDNRLREATSRASDRASAIALLFIDVDHFKSINDSHGHTVGDGVLREFARRIEASVRPADLAARWAGDEFVVLIELERASDEAQFIARKILSAMAKPFVIDQRVLTVGASIGVVVHRDPAACSADTLMAQADSSLYAAKVAGRGTLHLMTP